MSSQLKTAYEKSLLPFVRFMAVNKLVCAPRPIPASPAAAARAPCKPLLPTPQKQEPAWKSKRVLNSQAGDHGESRMGGRMGGMRAVPKPRM
jgi:hypothetical protein